MLLATPNAWCVVTGAPCSGKTTLLEALQQRGYAVCFEVARDCIDAALQAGQTLTQLRGTAAAEQDFQRQVLARKVDLEAHLDAQQRVFLERGIADTQAYATQQGWNIDLPASAYQWVFLLEPLPFAIDYARTETVEQAVQLHQLLAAAYAEQGTRFGACSRHVGCGARRLCAGHRYDGTGSGLSQRFSAASNCDFSTGLGI